jgi:beta-lactamase class A
MKRKVTMNHHDVFLRVLALFVLLLATTPAVEAQPLNEIAGRLETIAADVPGTLGYYVMTPEGEELFSRNSEASFAQASAIKIPILLEVLAQREAGKIDWNQPHRIEKNNQVSGSGILSQLSDGGSQMSTGDLCVMMIVLSDNTATNLLIELVGMENVNRRLDALVCPNTRLRRVMMDTAASARGEENVSTPVEAARIMQVLAQGKFLSREISNEVLAILRKPKSTAVRKAVPEEISVATKPGGIPGVATGGPSWNFPVNPTSSCSWQRGVRKHASCRPLPKSPNVCINLWRRNTISGRVLLMLHLQLIPR